MPRDLAALDLGFREYIGCQPVGIVLVDAVLFTVCFAGAFGGTADLRAVPDRFFVDLVPCDRIGRRVVGRQDRVELLLQEFLRTGFVRIVF